MAGVDRVADHGVAIAGGKETSGGVPVGDRGRAGNAPAGKTTLRSGVWVGVAINAEVVGKTFLRQSQSGGGVEEKRNEKRDLHHDDNRIGLGSEVDWKILAKVGTYLIREIIEET